MNISLTGIVLDVKLQDNFQGKPLPPDRHTDAVLLLDRPTGGNVALTFPAHTGLEVGQDIQLEAEVKPTVNNFKLKLYVRHWSAGKKAAAPAPKG